MIQPVVGQQLNAAAMSSPSGTAQAVATSGLLPIYGVDLGVDKNWVDAAFPSQSTDFANAGVNASFQQVWDALKPAGFNFVRIGFDVYDLPASANRAANVCNWAKNNNAKVLLVLRGTSNSSSGDYVSAAGAFVKALSGLLKQDAYKTAYAQVAAYELEPDLNNPSLLKQVSSQSKAQDLLTQAAQNIRTSETQELQGSGIGATPISVRASFDYELISTKAIAGTSLSDDAYAAAYSSLVQFLKPLGGSPNIDLIVVEWFPGTISAGGVDKPPALLRSLGSDIPGKQFIFTTGFSTAFHSPDEQAQYYTMTFANLADLRASGGPSSPFAGVVYREALNAKSPTAPSLGLPQAMSTWDWTSKAGELASLWTDQKKSDDMSWWLQMTRDNMGLLDAQADAFDASSLKPKGGMLALAQISSAVNSAAAGVGGQMSTAAAPSGMTPSQPMSGAMAGQGMPNSMPAQPMQGMSPGQAMPGSGMPAQALSSGMTPGQPMSGGAMPGQTLSTGMPGQTSSGGMVSELGRSLQSKTEQTLAGLLDTAMQRLGNAAQSGINGVGRGGPSNPSAGFGQGPPSGFLPNSSGMPGMNLSAANGMPIMNPGNPPCPMAGMPQDGNSPSNAPTDTSGMMQNAMPCPPGSPMGMPSAPMGMGTSMPGGAPMPTTPPTPDMGAQMNIAPTSMPLGSAMGGAMPGATVPPTSSALATGTPVAGAPVPTTPAPSAMGSPAAGATTTTTASAAVPVQGSPTSVTPPTATPVPSQSGTPSATPTPSPSIGAAPTALARAQTIPGTAAIVAPPSRGPVAPPGFAMAAGSITLAKQDITLQPSTPKVGQPVQITANLHNQNPSPAAGIMVLASGARNSVLAEADSLQLAPNSAYRAILRWTPSDPSPTPITIHVSDGTGTEIASVSLDPIPVAPATPTSTSAQAPSGASSIGTNANATATNNTGTSSTLAPLGFAKIGGLQAPNLIAGIPGTIVVPISNPLLVPLSNIRAALMVDGKTVQTQDVSSLLSQQSRSIVFANVVIAQPGIHQARVGVQLQRGAKSQVGAVTQNVFVQPPPVMNAALKNPAASPTSVKAGQKNAPPALRSIVPPSQPINTTATAVTTAALPPAAAKAGAVTSQQAQLTLSSTDLSYSPIPARFGQPVAFRVIVRNASTIPVQSAALVLSLYADGRLVATQPAVQFALNANSTYQASWQATMPMGHQVQLVASVGGQNFTPVKAAVLLQSAALPTQVQPGAVKPGMAKRP